MSKTFETKNKILDILKQGAKTPTEIGKTLGLSPSTVSQHLKELKETGRLEELQDEHFKNIKYYRRTENASILTSNNAKYAYGALAIIIFAALIFSLFNQSAVGTVYAHQSVQTNGVGIFFTDPPQVPNGTQSLTVSYSSLRALVTNSSGTFWIPVNGSGTVNLLSWVNFTKNLSTLELPLNSVVDRFNMNISNATIMINGTAYPVVITNKSISVKVFYNNQNRSAYDILFDMFPTVSAVITGNQTIFIMAPSATAITIDKSINPYYNYSRDERSGNYSNQPCPINVEERDMLDRVKTNITITSASISTVGNQTSISINVADNSNQSTQLVGAIVLLRNFSYNLNLNLSNNRLGTADPLRHIQYGAYMSGSFRGRGQFIGNLSPNDNFAMNFSARFNQSDTDAFMDNFSNDSERSYINGMFNDRGFNISSNATGNIIMGRIIKQINSGSYIRARLRDFDSISFFVAQNGTLLLPHLMPRVFLMNNTENEPDLSELLPKGYDLNSGSSVTLRYNSALTLGNNLLNVEFVPGQTYRIIVIGTGDAIAEINVTAS